MLQRSENTFAQLYKTGPGALVSDARTDRALPVGREQNDASAKCRCHARGRERRADTKMRSRSGWLRLKRPDELNPYAAAFFVTFVGALTAGFGEAVFAAFAFSFAANSCLTVVVIAATSTL